MTNQNRLKEEFVNFRDQFNKVLEETFSINTGGLQVDVYETDETLVVTTGALLGLQVNSVDISITDGNQLTLSGQTVAPDDPVGATYHKRERKFGEFSRTVLLPVKIVAEDAKASYKDNVLSITLPKVHASKPQVVKITPVE